MLSERGWAHTYMLGHVYVMTLTCAEQGSPERYQGAAGVSGAGGAGVPGPRRGGRGTANGYRLSFRGDGTTETFGLCELKGVNCLHGRVTRILIKLLKEAICFARPCVVIVPLYTCLLRQVP